MIALSIVFVSSEMVRVRQGHVSLAAKIRLDIPRQRKRVLPYFIGSLASFWLIERTVGVFDYSECKTALTIRGQYQNITIDKNMLIKHSMHRY
jgi:hypothetical protein